MEIVIRPAVLTDAEYIAANLRLGDRREIAKSGLDCRSAVLASFSGSDDCFTADIDGVPAMIFGVESRIFEEGATVWALGTDACSGVPLQMVKVGRKIIKTFLTKYSYLENYTDADYEQSHRWLRSLGFSLGEPEPHGGQGALFRKLIIRRQDICV